MNTQISLKAAEIDNLSEALVNELTTQYKFETKDARRISLTMEEILLNIREKYGDDFPVEIHLRKRFGKISLQVIFGGDTFDPRMDSGEISTLLTMYDLIPNYSFKNRKNIVSIPASQKKAAALPKIMTALVISILMILLAEFLPGDGFKTLIGSLASPIFETIIGFIVALSGPIIFLSVLSGILAIADLSTLKSAGLRILRDTVCLIGFSVVISLIVPMKLYGMRLMGNNSSLSDGSAILQMVLDIVPDNLFSPFISGNSMQIIFLAIVIGIVILALGSKITMVSSFVCELQNIFQQLMTWVNGLLPFLVCITVLHIYASGQADIVLKSLSTLAIALVISLFLTMILVLYISIRYKVSVMAVIKKMLPTYIIATITSSSSAAYVTNCETCRSKYGIDSSLVDFGIPFGQVICMPGCAVVLACICSYLASFYDIEITPAWIAAALIGITLISMAAPPIPGGGMAILSTTLTLLGIPLEGLAIAVPLEMIMEYLVCGVNLLAIQTVLIRVADKLNKLDLSVLRSKQ